MFYAKMKTFWKHMDWCEVAKTIYLLFNIFVYFKLWKKLILIQFDLIAKANLYLVDLTLC